MHPQIAYAVGLLRRATPPLVVPLLVRARLERARADSARQADAREQMEFLLGRSRPDADVEEAARRYLERWVWRAELRWRPRMINRQRVVGIDRLLAAHAQGRGVVLNFMHHGAYEGAFTSLARLGARCEVVVHPRMLEKSAPEHLKQHLRAGRHLVGIHPTTIGVAGITELVRAGRIVAIATDAPGSTPLTWCGRPVLGSSGAARIAVEVGAPVVPLHTAVDDRGPHLLLTEPLEPADFPDAEALLEQMVRRHEAYVLAYPEAADSPLSRWRRAEQAAAEPA